MADEKYAAALSQIRSLRPMVAESHKKLDDAWEAIAKEFAALPLILPIETPSDLNYDGEPIQWLSYRKFNGKRQFCVEELIDPRQDCAITPYPEWSARRRAAMVQFLPALIEEAKLEIEDFANTADQAGLLAGTAPSTPPKEKTPADWFADKQCQISHHAITAFGIRLESRYGNANEMAQMLNFAADCARDGLEAGIQSVFYNSKNSLCSFEFSQDHNEDSDFAKAVKIHALKNIACFDWYTGVQYGMGNK